MNSKDHRTKPKQASGYPIQKGMKSLLDAAACLAAAVSCATAAHPGESLPNVVFILADDIGWADPGRYHEHHSATPALVPTPNLNRLCDQGMMFTDAQLPSALCAPNRFCLMTGNYSHRSRPSGTWNRTASSAFNYGDAVNDRADNPHRTVGEVLHDAGYRNAYFGKMHFGGNFYNSAWELQRDLNNDQLHRIDYTKKFGDGLLDHGFDYTFVNPDGIQGPMYMWFENDKYRPISDFAAEVAGVTPAGASTLRSYAGGETVGDGEMVALGYGDSNFDTSDHGPILSHFAVKFIEDHVANHPDKPFMMYYATPAIHLPITPSVDGIEARGATGLGDRSDFVYDLDAQVGRILGALDRLGVADNTIVIFTSDNGGHTPGAPAGQDPNGPLRGNKGSIYEGGHRVPFIWKWGDGTAAGSIIRPGTVCNQLVSVLDWVPSMVDLTGGAVAADQHQDSTSLLPLLFSEAPDAEEPVRQWHFHRTTNNPAYFGVRRDDAQGKWFYLRSTDGAPIELYDLATDLAQQTNLVDGFAAIADLPAGHPHKARLQEMDAWFLVHDATYDARTTEARNYQPSSTETDNAIEDPGFEEADAASTYPEEGTSPWQILDEQGGVWGTQVMTDNGTTARSGSNLFSFQFYYIVDDALVQDVAFPIDAGQAHELSFWARLGESGAQTGVPTLRLQWLASPTFGSGYTVMKQVDNLLPAEGAWTKFTLAMSAAELAPYDGQFMRVRLKKMNANTSHRIAIDDFSLTRETPFGGPPVKTPVPVPVPKPRVGILRSEGGFDLWFDGLETDVVYQIEQSSDPGSGWTPQESFGGQPSWSTQRPMAGERMFFRASHPARVGRLDLSVP